MCQNPPQIILQAEAKKIREIEFHEFFQYIQWSTRKYKKVQSKNL